MNASASDRSDIVIVAYGQFILPVLPPSIYQYIPPLCFLLISHKRTVNQCFYFFLTKLLRLIRTQNYSDYIHRQCSSSIYLVRFMCNLQYVHIELISKKMRITWLSYTQSSRDLFQSTVHENALAILKIWSHGRTRKQLNRKCRTLNCILSIQEFHDHNRCKYG